MTKPTAAAWLGLSKERRVHRLASLRLLAERADEDGAESAANELRAAADALESMEIVVVTRKKRRGYG